MSQKKTFLQSYDELSKLSECVSVGATRKLTDFVGTARHLSGEGESSSVHAFLEHIREGEDKPIEDRVTKTPEGKAR